MFQTAVSLESGKDVENEAAASIASGVLPAASAHRRLRAVAPQLDLHFHPSSLPNHLHHQVRFPPNPPTFSQFLKPKTNKPQTTQVGAPLKAQKQQQANTSQCQVFSSTVFFPHNFSTRKTQRGPNWCAKKGDPLGTSILLQNIMHSVEKCQRGPFEHFQHPFCCKYKKTERGTFRDIEMFSKKRVPKKLKGGPVLYVTKKERLLLFTSLGQMVQS